MQNFVTSNLIYLCAAMLVAPAQISAAQDRCATGRYLYEPVIMGAQQAEPVIQITYFKGANALPEELDLIRAWPEIIGLAPPASVEIEQEERLGIWPQNGSNHSSDMYRIQLEEVFVLLLDTAHYNSAYREVRPLMFVDMPERIVPPRQYEFAVVPLYLRN